MSILPYSITSMLDVPIIIEKSPAMRMAICKECEWFRASIKQCKKCSCFMPAKVRLKSAKCPIRKW